MVEGELVGSKGAVHVTLGSGHLQDHQLLRFTAVLVNRDGETARVADIRLDPSGLPLAGEADVLVHDIEPL